MFAKLLLAVAGRTKTGLCLRITAMRQPIALAGDVDDDGVLRKTVEDRLLVRRDYADENSLLSTPVEYAVIVQPF